MTNIPYTYLIGWTALNKWYYGVRFSKKCHPDELWISYFTSSNVVKQYIEEYGNPDVITIRKRFDDVNAARKWEKKVLKRMNVVCDPKWLNQTDSISICLDKVTIGQIASKLSEKYKGSGNPFYGKTHTKEVRQILRDFQLAKTKTEKELKNLRTVWIGRKRSDENKEKLAKYASSRFFIVNKDGTVRHCFDANDERLLSGEFIRGRTWKN